MVEKGVTLSRLAELVAAYGVVADRWPADERQGAEALLLRSPEARALLERERELDRLLAAAPDAVPSVALVARLMAARPRAASSLIRNGARGEGGFWRMLAQSVWPYGSPVLPAGALAASVLVGVGFGAAMPSAVSAFGLATATVVTSEPADDRLVSIALADNEYPEDWKP